MEILIEFLENVVNRLTTERSCGENKNIAMKGFKLKQVKEAKESRVKNI